MALPVYGALSGATEETVTLPADPAPGRVLSIMMRLPSITSVTLALVLSGCEKSPPTAPAMDPQVASSIEEFKNRRIYRQLTPEILATIPDHKLEQAVVDYVHGKIGDNYSRAGEIVGGLPAGIRALYITWMVEAEVNNGGFNQYYWNSSGQFADQAVGAFEFFSAEKHADLMREANRIRSLEAVRMQEFKDRGSAKAFSESYDASTLGPLDDRFYRIEEDLSALRVAKIRASPALFSGG